MSFIIISACLSKDLKSLSLSISLYHFFGISFNSFRFYRELEGEFVAEVFDEDSSLIEHFRTAGLQIDSKSKQKSKISKS